MTSCFSFAASVQSKLARALDLTFNPIPRTLRQGDRMKRREFIALFTSVATCLLFVPSAVRAAHIPKIGVLVAGAPDPQLFWTTFQKAMHDLGYVEGQNLQFEYRSAGEKSTLSYKGQRAIVLENFFLL